MESEAFRLGATPISSCTQAQFMGGSARIAQAISSFSAVAEGRHFLWSSGPSSPFRSFSKSKKLKGATTKHSSLFNDSYTLAHHPSHLSASKYCDLY